MVLERSPGAWKKRAGSSHVSHCAGFSDACVTNSLSRWRPGVREAPRHEIAGRRGLGFAGSESSRCPKMMPEFDAMQKVANGASLTARGLRPAPRVVRSLGNCGPHPQTGHNDADYPSLTFARCAAKVQSGWNAVSTFGPEYAPSVFSGLYRP